MGGVVGGGIGLATGVISLFPAPRSVAVCGRRPTGGGALVGAVAGHAAAGMSRKDLKELGEHFDAGQSGLVVVAVSDMEAKVKDAMTHAQKIESKTMQSDSAQLEADAKEATA